MMLWPENPALVELYDIECAGRYDHDFYLELAAELPARTVVDLGCGTGVFAVDLAERGHTAIGVDPAAAILDAARSRPGSDTVRWIHGDLDLVDESSADLVVMMGHVAQYFVSDEAWTQVLRQIRRVLKPGGHLTFESRRADRGWRDRWTQERTTSTYPHPRGGEFTAWVQAVQSTGEPKSFAMTHEGHSVLPDGSHLVSTETLRFRSEAEIRESLSDGGFELREFWGDWDRSPAVPTTDEMIFLAESVSEPLC